MKFLIFFIFAALNLTAFARNKSEIYILTSIKTQTYSELRALNYLKSQINERTTKSTLQNNFKITIIHETSPATLWSILHSENTSAIIWISHSKPNETLGNNIFNSGKIETSQGYNVSDFFANIPSNIKFLSMVGCKNKSLFDDINNSRFKDADFTLNTFESKVDAYSGFLKSIFALEKKFNKEIITENVSELFNTQDYIRINGLNLLLGKELKIKLGNTTIAVLKINDDSIEIPLSFYINQGLNIGIEVYADIQIPDLTIYSSAFSWKPLKLNGTNIGFNRNLYLPYAQ